MIKKILLIFLQAAGLFQVLSAQSFVAGTPKPGYFPLFNDDSTTSIYTDSNDAVLVQKTAALMQSDIEKVTGRKLPWVHRLPPNAKNILLLGTLGHSSLIDRLIREKKINVQAVRGRWEAYLLQTCRHPFKGIEHALVIAGSDRRGAAYGAFTVSKEIGVSPWYWWADVPVPRKTRWFVRENLERKDAPKVKYRGIFLNDEAPALSGWSKEKFGGFNHLFYEKVFELILRLKGNYLWPAMWGNAFYDDDAQNKQSADDYGIVIGTSHHEPLMRAHDEWRRYGKGPWNYDSNAAVLKKFWEEGMKRVQHTETIVSIGMRGDGDKPMTEGTAIALLERIVKDQRKIIEKVTGKPASQTPQLWALYKEVQDYYDKGMRVPDDVTLLLCDDNWGNIRKLPRLLDPHRAGGYGIYYHFDYVGDPRNYKWINTNNISRVWEQMHLAYRYGVKNIWIVNVGDLKPMELPISFFLDDAWDPDKWNTENIIDYYTSWAGDQFGKSRAEDIGYLLSKYAQLSAVKKPELLTENTYSLLHYRESDRVTGEWVDLLKAAMKLYDRIPSQYRNAYFELVLHPVEAFTNLYRLYNAVAHNRYLAKTGQVMANRMADSAKQWFQMDSMITLDYHRIAGGKWNHMMDQTHIGYTYWQQPPENKMPELDYVPEDAVEKVVNPLKPTAVSAEKGIPAKAEKNTFFERNGYVSIQAGHFTRAFHGSGLSWKIIEGIGREGAGVSCFPVTKDEKTLKAGNPRLEYDFYAYDSGNVKLFCYFSPTLNFPNHPGGLQYAVSLDDEKPQICSVNQEDNDKKIWAEWVADNIIIRSTVHHLSRPGKHKLRYWMISPAVILQKMVMDMGGLESSYLGPPETKIR